MIDLPHGLTADDLPFPIERLNKIKKALSLMDKEIPQDMAKEDYLKKLNFYSILIYWANNDPVEAANRYQDAHQKAHDAAMQKIEKLSPNCYPTEEQKALGKLEYKKIIDRFYDGLIAFIDANQHLFSR